MFQINNDENVLRTIADASGNAKLQISFLNFSHINKDNLCHLIDRVNLKTPKRTNITEIYNLS